jgi:predicted  nucleic acid-binding Zn-ribbon protein
MEKEKLLPLLALQETDQEIGRIEVRLKKIGEERNQLKEELTSARRRLDELQSAVGELERRIRDLRERIEDEERLLEGTEKKLRMVRKDVEYKALLREKSKHEDNILKMSYQLDDLEEELKRAKEVLDREKPKVERRLKEIKEEIEDLNDEEKIGLRKLEELKKQREERKKEVDESLLDFYERARKKFDNAVIVSVQEEVCTGCGMKVPDVLFSKMLKEKSIEICPSCGRYIYYKL